MSHDLTNEDVEELFETSNRQIREETMAFHRYLMQEIDWRDRLICIKGPRGTGKTTLLRQKLKEQFGEDSPNAIYASLDDLWFARHSLKDLVDYLYDHVSGVLTPHPKKKLVLDDRNGTGDTLASAIATHLAKGDDLATAVERAEAYMSYFLAGPRYYISAGI